MKKSELAALGMVFAAEINGRLPFQSKAKVFQRLCADGFLQQMQRRAGYGIFAATLTGYELTHAGRIAYCTSCKDEPPISGIEKSAF
jgi:hypothetical protein